MLISALTCVAAALLLQVASLPTSSKGVQVISKAFPNQKVKPKYDASQWEKILTSLKPDVDGPILANASVSQPADSGTVGSPVQTQIIGGQVSSRGQFPWQAGFTIDGQYFCGGSLISPSHVLTAAHCTQSFTTFAVILGAQDKSVFEAGRITVETDKKEVHSKFNPDTLINDIAILYLPMVVSTTTNLIKTIRLPSMKQAKVTFEGVNATVSGWGRTSDSDWTVSPVLNNVVLPVISNADCLMAFGSDYVHSSNICVSGKEFKSTCNGDSGGPLVIKEKDGLWTQLGLVSFGSAEGCAASYPSAFTRVSSYLCWISARTGLMIRSG